MEPTPARAATPPAVLGKCQIQRELGQGGMGVVYLARHTTLDVLVAVKVLSKEAAHASPTAAKRFVREAKLAARIHHPNLVSVMDSDTDPASGAAYIVMEYVDGPSVNALIQDGALEPGTATRIALGVAKALEAAAQSDIIHRDVKPANILVASDGTVKMTDLGLAKDLHGEKITATSATIGTPCYMSPEQVQKNSALDCRTDVYSLGATLYEMLTGRVPFQGTSFFELAREIVKAPVPDPRQVKPGIDRALAELTMRMMSKVRGDRPERPAAVARELAAWLDQAGEAAGPASRASRAPVPGGDWRLRAAGGVAILLILLALFLRMRLLGAP